jgi:hypothetical protein
MMMEEEDSNSNKLGIISRNNYEAKTSKNDDLESSCHARSTYISTATTSFCNIIPAKHQPTKRETAEVAMVSAVPYHKWRELQALVLTHGNNGITFINVQKRFALKKKQARNLLYSYLKQGKLHTAGRKRPQRYFLTKQAAEFEYLQSTYNDVRGVNPSNKYHNYPAAHIRAFPYSAATSLEHRIQFQEQEEKRAAAPAAHDSAADTLLNALAKAELAPLGVHNMHLKVRLITPPYDAANDDNPYDRVSESYLEKGNEGKRNRTKLYSERVGDKEISYRLYPNNTVIIIIACTENPFPLDSQEHVTSLFCFLGGRRDTLRLWLSDISDQFVPHVHDWCLVEADLNRDVQLTPALYYHMNMIKIQLRTVEGVFREYAKSIYGHFYFRQEKMLTDSVPLSYSSIYRLMANTSTSYSVGGGGGSSTTGSGSDGDDDGDGDGDGSGDRNGSTSSKRDDVGDVGIRHATRKEEGVAFW